MSYVYDLATRLCNNRLCLMPDSPWRWFNDKCCETIRNRYYEPIDVFNGFKLDAVHSLKKLFVYKNAQGPGQIDTATFLNYYGAKSESIRLTFSRFIEQAEASGLVRRSVIDSWVERHEKTQAALQQQRDHFIQKYGANDTIADAMRQGQHLGQQSSEFTQAVVEQNSAPITSIFSQGQYPAEQVSASYTSLPFPDPSIHFGSSHHFSPSSHWVDVAQQSTALRPSFQSLSHNISSSPQGLDVAQQSIASPQGLGLARQFSTSRPPSPFQGQHLAQESSSGGVFETIRSPLDQFEIRNFLSLDAPVLGNLSLSLTNIALYLTIAGYLVFMLNLLSTNKNKVISNPWSIGQESVYATVHSIVVNQINEKKGQIYFPFMYVLFMFILINNLVGMIPYSFSPTSHFVLTFSLSFTVVLGATILGLSKHGLKFFSLFVPNGCPLGLLPLLVLIEFISYLARNVSLGLRLAANILSGHMLLNILSGFTYNIMNSGYIFFFLGLLPLVFIIAFSGLELGIAFIQAQVFVVLSCSYIKDALELH